ncbi:MAG: hypothetical protein WC559_01860 [Candidatus Omnitrophota bacterium]
MFAKLDERLKRLNVLDIGLVKWSAFFSAVIIVKLFPQLLKVNYAFLIVLMLACGARPLYRFWFKR